MRVKVSPGTIAGDVDDGYGKLADVFAAICSAARRSEPPSPSTATA